MVRFFSKKNSETLSRLLKTMTALFVSVFKKIRQNVAYFICFAYLCNTKGNLWLCFCNSFCGEVYGVWGLQFLWPV